MAQQPAVGSKDACPHCGKPVGLRWWTLLPSTDRRRRLKCQACGKLYDLSDNSKISAMMGGMAGMGLTVLLLFGNPKTGTPLIQQRRTMGIDLPLKILIWEEEGKVKLAYNDPSYLARRHGVENAAVLTQVEKALRSFAGAATKP